MRFNDPRYLGSPTDVVRGFRVGAALGALFAVREAFTSHLGSLAPSPGNPMFIAAVVFAGGCVAGTVAGAFRPVARRIPGAITVGVLAAFPVMVALDAIRSRVTYPVGSIDWLVDVLAAVVIGTIGGLAIRSGRH